MYIHSVDLQHSGFLVFPCHGEALLGVVKSEKLSKTPPFLSTPNYCATKEGMYLLIKANYPKHGMREAERRSRLNGLMRLSSKDCCVWGSLWPFTLLRSLTLHFSHSCNYVNASSISDSKSASNTRHNSTLWVFLLSVDSLTGHQGPNWNLKLTGSVGLVELWPAR